MRGAAGLFSYPVRDAVYETWLTPVRNAAGEVTGVAGLSHDVSELRKLQSNAIQNDRVIALGTLAASVAHEINNPQTFTRSNEDDDAIVDVRTVVHAVQQLVGKEVEARARLEVDLQETRSVRGDKARLVQVVLNLVANALHEIGRSKRLDHRIALATRETRDERVVIEVIDTGPGVPEGQRERIFEPFVSGKEVGQGSGLGLFVSGNIVRAVGVTSRWLTPKEAGPSLRCSCP